MAAPVVAALAVVSRAIGAITARASALAVRKAMRMVVRNAQRTTTANVVDLQQRLGQSLKQSGLMPQIDMKVLGVKETVDTLKRMETAVRNRIVRRAAAAAARTMAEHVRVTTYNDNSRKRRTGLMETSVRVATKVERDKVKAFVTESKRGRPSPFYWWFLERGTATRSTRKGANRGAIFPRPWVAPAAASTQARALARFAAVLKSGVERETQKRGG